MIKQFLLQAGRKLKRLAGSGEKKKKSASRVEQESMSSGERLLGPAAEQKSSPAQEGQTRPRQKPRKKKPRWNLDRFPVDPVAGKSRFHDFSLPLGIMHAVADLDFQ
ncbi:MAG: hypothetical protein D3904_04665, partial [Candidatus Electrothrix sp. EH2]|nr:hypothetical protein [Candidatus Electrothrix sp. EH2]